MWSYSTIKSKAIIDFQIFGELTPHLTPEPYWVGLRSHLDGDGGPYGDFAPLFTPIGGLELVLLNKNVLKHNFDNFDMRLILVFFSYLHHNSQSLIIIYIMSKKVLAGPHDLLSLASVAELSWMCGWYFILFYR